MTFIVLLPILTPLFTAATCLLLWGRPSAQRIVSVAGGAALLASGVALMAATRHQVLVAQPSGWAAPYGITIVADLFSAVMTAVAGLIGLSVLVYSWFGIDQPRQRFGFHPLFHVLLMGVCGSFLTGDIFNMYVWFEVMLIASFVLMALGGEKRQLEGAIKYVTINLISSALFLAAAGVLYATSGTLNLADLARRLSVPEGAGAANIAGGILLIAFGVKAAAFPLFFWLPASYHTPPAAVSAVMAGLLTKVGVYALVRMFSLLFVHDFVHFQPLLLGIAAATMATGVLGAASQNEFRRILSFHIISQIGYMLMGLAIFTPLALAGTIFYLAHHIIVKTNLFLIAGVVQRLQGSYQLSRLGGLYRDRPWLAALFLVPAMSLAGLPPLSGFWAKLALIRAGLEAEHYWLVGTALAVSLLTLFSMTKIWGEAFWKAAPEDLEDSHDHDTPAHNAAAVRWMAAPSIVLAALTVLIGLAAEPLFALASATAEQLLNPQLYIDAVLKEGA